MVRLHCLNGRARSSAHSGHGIHKKSQRLHLIFRHDRMSKSQSTNTPSTSVGEDFVFQRSPQEEDLIDQLRGEVKDGDVMVCDIYVRLWDAVPLMGSLRGPPEVQV